MKKILLFISLLSFMGCGDYSSRRDLSSNITFTSSIPQGKYSFNLISFNYPNTYIEKTEFYKTLNTGLKELNTADLSMVNLLIPKSMETDLDSIINKGWFDQEILAMKNASDLSQDEIKTLSNLKISTPENAGDIQKYLNEQYYLLLKLTNNENMYLSNYSYTELDKINLMEDTLLSRNSLREFLKEMEKNFVYTEETPENNYPENAIFTNSKNISQFKNPVVFSPSKEFSGFKVNRDNILLFVGNGKKLLDTNNYEFTSNITFIQSPLEIKNTVRKNNSSPISNILYWTRKEQNTVKKTTSLESQFSTWED